MELNQQAIQDAIVTQAVGHFINDDALYERVKAGVEARIDALFETKVRALIEASIEASYKDGLERTYTKRDGFGRPDGEPTSISKELERLISGYWEQKVGRDGKLTTNSYDAVSRAEWMMTQLCADDFSGQMRQHIINVGGALKDHFRAVLERHLASMLSEVFHVQSAGDRDRKKPGRSCIAPPAKPIGVR